MPSLLHIVPIRVSVFANLANPVSQVGYHTELWDLWLSYKTPRTRTVSIVSDGGNQDSDTDSEYHEVRKMKVLTSQDNQQNN